MNLVRKLIDLDRAAPKRIAVIGDAMIDMYVHGRLEVGQEGCPKFVETERIVRDGGAANAAMSIRQWNTKANLLAANGSTKTRFLVDSKTIFRHDHEEVTDALCDGELNIFWNYEPDAVLISDYDKGFLTPEMIRKVIEWANERGVPVVADPKRHPSIYAGAILKTNEAYDDRYEDEFSDASHVCTFGDRAPLLVEVSGKDYEFEHRVWHGVECINHVGAGDCFAAHLTLALAHGFSLEDAAAVAHSAGRVYVQHPHNRAPYPHEVARDYDPVLGKVITRSEDLHALRQSIQGRVVVTNGVFRVPHAGHTWLMRWAREQGDALVVLVNDDASAARQRPGEFVMPLQERMEMLAGLDAVDWVVPFAEDNPCAVLSELKADILVKGSEYAASWVPGAEHVREVRFAPAGPYPERCASGLVCEIVKKQKWR